jgi:DNA-binding transcriptional ArsR family regulator
MQVLRIHVDSRRWSTTWPLPHETIWLTFPAARPILNHMVNDQGTVLDLVFGALSDPTRRAMLRRLAAGERTVGELAEPFRMSLPAASKHLKVLERAGLVRRTVEGRTHRVRLNARRLSDAQRWLAYYQRFWTDRLDALDALLVPRGAPRRRRDTPTAPDDED